MEYIIKSKPKIVSKLISKILLDLFNKKLSKDEIFDLALLNQTNDSNHLYYNIVIKTIKIKLNEPIKMNGFILKFPERFNIISWTIQKANRPKFENNQWSNIEIEFMDTISYPAFKQLNRFIKNYTTIKPFIIRMIDLDPVGICTGVWMIKIGEVISVDFGNNDYSSNDIVKTKLTLKPISCKYVQ